MGQAKNRGSYEERIVQSKNRKLELQLKAEAALELRREQEALAYHIMTWWQLDMTKERVMKRNKHKFTTNLTLATLHGAFAGIGAMHVR